MPVDILKHLASLPREQTFFSVFRGPFHKLWINPHSQQRRCLEYRAVRRLFPVKVANGRIQQCYYMVHPVARSALTDLLTGFRFAVLSLHRRGTVSGPEKNVDRELQWTKSPPIEGLPQHNASCYDSEFNQQSLEGSVNGRWWLAIAALLWCGCAAALSPDLTIKELRHTAWGPSQGAPLGGALALAQTNDGYLWIAGPGGWFRFDGIAFRPV